MEKILLPCDEEAEQAILGSIFLKPDMVLSEMVGRIKPEHFNVPANATIYKEMLRLWSASKPIDAILITTELRDKGLLEFVGGPQYITSLYCSVPTAANASYYIETIIEKYILRKMLATCRDYDRRCNDHPEDPRALLGAMASELAGIEDIKMENRKTMKDLTIDKIDQLENGTVDSGIIPSGYRLIDKYSPLREHGYIILAAPAKTGKTTLATNILKNVAESGIPSVYFSLETAQSDIYDLLFSNESKIPAYRQFVGEGGMTQRDMERMGFASSKLSIMKIDIVADIFDIGGICAFVKKWKTQNPDGKLVVVDYVQLVKGSQQKGGNREQEVAEVSRTLRMLSMELDISIIALSQLNEAGETRESKSLQQDCTALWKLLHLFKETTNRNDEPEEELDKRLLMIDFQRKGPSKKTFPVAFIGETATVAELTEDQQ